jgi:hypothetical protein
MEKLVFEYLSRSNPDVYIKKTKFGHCICVPDKNMQWFQLEDILIKKIQSMFSCSERVAERLVDVWVNSRPVYVEIPNSTNDSVLMRKIN